MGELNISKSDTHATPSTGFQKLYPKLDGGWYSKKDDGTEETLATAHAASHAQGASDQLSHLNIADRGTNTHAQIDAHLAAPEIWQVGFAEVAADVTTTSTSFVDLTALSVTLTVATAGYLHIWFSVSADCSTLQDIAFQVLVDGTVQRGIQMRVTSAQLNSGAIVLRRSATAASHTVKIQWKTTGGTARITALTTPALFHGSLLVEDRKI
jgi:hypothetical protein